MAVIDNRVDIDRPPEAVFDYLVDLRNELTWNPGVQSMEKITPGPVGVGTQYRAKWKQSGTVIVECTSFDRPRGWAYRNGGPVSVEFDASVAPLDTGTRLDVRFVARPHGWFRLVFPVFVLVMKRQERTNMANLKRALEERRDERAH